MAGTLRQAMVFLGLADDGYEPQREREGRVDDDRSARREDRYDSVATGEHEVLDMEPVREDARSSRRGSAALEDFAAFDAGSPRRDQGLTEDEGDFDREPSAGVAGSHAAGLAEEADAESARGGRDLEPVRRSAPVRRDAEASANGHPDGRGARRAERRAESGASRRTASPRAEESETAPRTQGFRAPVTPINRAAAQIESDNELRRITTIHPRSYNDAKAIGESFRDNIPVIMNVTDMDVAEAKRLVDFSSGLTFALNGSIERVTEQVFLLTPANLEVLGAEETESAPRTDTGLPVFNQD